MRASGWGWGPVVGEDGGQWWGRMGASGRELRVSGRELRVSGRELRVSRLGRGQIRLVLECFRG